MNILVINLTRFGDLLQSAAAVRLLVDGGKNKVGVVCLENFTAGAKQLAGVTDVFPLPVARIMRRSNVGSISPEGGESSPSDWIGGLGCLYEWVYEVRSEFKPDAVCNLSPSTPSSLLGRLLSAGGEYSGFTLDDFGFSSATSLWASFIQGASSARTTSPFNIVDLFRKVARPDSLFADASLLPVPETAVRTMREKLALLAPESPAGFAALQLGASADIRRWPVASFARTGDALWREHRFFPVLLGTKGEIPLAEQYASLAREPFTSLMGETGLAELAAALTVSSLCISNDTGTLHLASGLGVPSIGIYLATAQPWDTGPYAAGSCSLEPDLACHPCNFGTACAHDYACHSAVTPETVIRLAAAKLDHNRWEPENIADSPLGANPFPGSRVWETVRDAFGFANLSSLSGHEKEGRTQWMRIQRHLYRQFFDKRPDASFAPLPTEEPFMFGPEVRASLLRTCGAMLALLDAMEQQAEMLAQNPIPIIRDRFNRTWQRLGETLRAEPDFAAIAFCWQTESMRQTDLKDAASLVRQYRDFFSTVKTLLL